MSAFVNGFFINPMLRQARRLSERTRERLGGDVRPAPEQPIVEDVDSESCNMRDRDIETTATVTVEGTPIEDMAPRTSQLSPGQQSPVVPESTAEMPIPSTTSHRSKALPEKDGHHNLRRRLQEIQQLGDSPEQKAQLMHKVMMEKYLRTQGKSHTEYQMHSHMATSGRNSFQESVLSTSVPDSTGKSWSGSLNVGTALKLWPSETEAQQVPLTKKDLEPTFSNIDPNAAPADMPSNSELPDPEARRLGCKHYLRNVKLQCSTCAKWYTCRFCHDEAEDHQLVRKETRNMLCMVCGCAQRASEVCIKCGEASARYYCNVCKLWDDHPDKPVYHCADCGICRKGLGLGKDFFHCKKCCVCIPIQIEKSHRCIERSTDCDCPICGDYLFTSPLPVVFMNCGHSIHHTCYSQYTQTSYKCPICNKSLRNMESHFRNLDVAIACQPMPVEYRDSRAVVLCNDCSSRSSVPYHWLGLKCNICRSYNTVSLQVLGRASGRAASGQAIDEQQLVEALESHRIGSNDRESAASQPQHSNPHSGSATPGRMAFSRGNSDMNLRTLLGGNMPLASPLSEENSDDDILGFWGPHSDPELGYVPSLWERTEADEDDGSSDEDDEQCESEEDDDEDDDDLILIGHR